MVDREKREDWRRERSLLALGQAVRGEEDASLVSIGDRAEATWREDAATRHRLARSQREVRSNPALAETELSQLGRESGPVAEARIEPDQTVRGSYTQARLWEEPVAPGISEAYSASTFEHRHAAEEQRFSRTDSDGQEWKPLIDPMQVVRGIARSKVLIVTTTILGAALGIAIALSTPKKYEATTELIVDPQDLKLSDRDLTQSVYASDATLASVENKVRILTSGNVLNKVVDKLNLVNDPEFNGQGSGGLGLKSLIGSILSRHEATNSIDEVRRRALAVGNLAESLSVERGGKTFVITIGATTQNGEKSALIANTMAGVALQTFGQIQSDTAGRATDELTSKLDELRKSVEAAERKVEDFRAAHDLVDAQGHLISDDEMLKLNEQLSVARARTLELNARATSARSLDVNSVLNGTLPEEINSNTMSDLRSQYATLKQEADRAAVRLGPRHPELQALGAQLAGARERIAGELRRIASSLQVDLKRAVQLEQDLASRLAQAKVRSGDVNSDLVTLRELEREAAAKRSVYEQYLLRAKETGEQRDINTANINVISPAFAPLEPNGPSRILVVLAGLLLGLASGVGLGVVRGAYESLRETATSRSRRKTDERRSEDKAYQAAPSPAPQVEAARSEPSGPVSALLSAIRQAMPGEASREKGPDTRDGEPISRAVRRPLPPHATPQQAMDPAARVQAYPHGQQTANPQPWQMQPPAGYPYSQPEAPHFGQVPYPGRSAEASHVQDTGEQQTQIDEIRASLREFREAVRELTESRSRRRYF